jgi:2'-5' RNA ligase
VRLFVAVELPDELRRAVAEAVAAGRRRLPPAGWVRPENLHLTLVFLGEVAAPRAAGIAPVLRPALAGRGPFTVRSAAPGAFPERGPVRVVWLGLEPASALGELADRLRAALSAERVPFDAKPFRAHVTLARARTAWPAGARANLDRIAPPERSFALEEVVLFESDLRPEGARYRALDRLRLGEAA